MCLSIRASVCKCVHVCECDLVSVAVVERAMIRKLIHLGKASLFMKHILVTRELSELKMNKI